MKQIAGVVLAIVIPLDLPVMLTGGGIVLRSLFSYKTHPSLRPGEDTLTSPLALN